MNRFLNDGIRAVTALFVGASTVVTDVIWRCSRGRGGFADYPISTGPLEGTDTKIKTIQRYACGFRDREFFKVKIYALHRTKYALV